MKTVFTASTHTIPLLYSAAAFTSARDTAFGGGRSARGSISSISCPSAGGARIRMIMDGIMTRNHTGLRHRTHCLAPVQGALKKHPLQHASASGSWTRACTVSRSARPTAAMNLLIYTHDGMPSASPRRTSAMGPRRRRRPRHPAARGRLRCRRRTGREGGMSSRHRKRLWLAHARRGIHRGDEPQHAAERA